MKKGRSNPAFFFLRQSKRLRLRVLRLGLLLRLGPVEQLHQGHRRIVSLPESVLQDPEVAAVALGVARPELGEELRHEVAVAQAGEREAPVWRPGATAEG